MAKKLLSVGAKPPNFQVKIKSKGMESFNNYPQTQAHSGYMGYDIAYVDEKIEMRSKEINLEKSNSEKPGCSTASNLGYRAIVSKMKPVTELDESTTNCDDPARPVVQVTEIFIGSEKEKYQIGTYTSSDKHQHLLKNYTPKENIHTEKRSDFASVHEVSFDKTAELFNADKKSDIVKSPSKVSGSNQFIYVDDSKSNKAIASKNTFQMVKTYHRKANKAKKGNIQPLKLNEVKIERPNLGNFQQSPKQRLPYHNRAKTKLNENSARKKDAAKRPKLCSFHAFSSKLRDFEDTRVIEKT